MMERALIMKMKRRQTKEQPSNIASRTELFNGQIGIVTAPGKGCTPKYSRTNF